MWIPKYLIQIKHKVHRKNHGSKRWHQNCIPIPLCVTELICSLSPDKSRQYIGFWYVDGKMINQLDACKLKNDKVFHMHVALPDENTDNFIEILPNPSAWEISNSEKRSIMRELDVCFNNMDTFLETLHYCYNNMVDG